jgi:hypothetical protein
MMVYIPICTLIKKFDLGEKMLKTKEVAYLMTSGAGLRDAVSFLILLVLFSANSHAVNSKREECKKIVLEEQKEKRDECYASFDQQKKAARTKRNVALAKKSLSTCLVPLEKEFSEKLRACLRLGPTAYNQTPATPAESTPCKNCSTVGNGAVQLISIKHFPPEGDERGGRVIFEFSGAVNFPQEGLRPHEGYNSSVDCQAFQTPLLIRMKKGMGSHKFCWGGKLKTTDNRTFVYHLNGFLNPDRDYELVFEKDLIDSQGRPVRVKTINNFRSSKTWVGYDGESPSGEPDGDK